MDVLQLQDAETKPLIVTMLQKRNLVPVLGAGFTKGAKTTLASVPAAEDFKMIMLGLLKKHVGTEANRLEGATFAEVAGYFLNPEFIPTEVVKDVIRMYFTEVKLSDDRKAFLSCPWPYIYTLNIDDAIEHNSEFRNKVVPNRPLSDISRELSCVYKVHGDATDELIYDEPSKIIFSTAQYVRSLTTNTSMLNSLKTDLTEQNTLFVGCSLDQEIDLLYALAEYNQAFPKGRCSIFVTNKAPDRFDEARFASHGVNTILLVQDYDQFYRTIERWWKEAERSTTNLIASYLRGPTVQRLGNDMQANLSFLLRDSDRLRSHGDVVIPDYCIRRDIEDTVLETSERETITLIRGRRFSGKTLLLRGLASSAKARQVYLLESDTRVSEEVLDELARVRNGLFLFDTNVLSPESALHLVRQLPTFRQNNSAAVVAVNLTEQEIVGVLWHHVDDSADMELTPWFSANECGRVNQKLDALGLRRFDFGKTILDNTFALLEQYPRVKSELSRPGVVDGLTESEVSVLLVTTIADKSFSSLATALQLRTTELYGLSQKLAPIVEVVETSRAELRITNSRYKLVVNSKIGLALLIRSIVKSKGTTWISQRLSTLVTRLLGLPKFASIGHSMYMFDAINYILSPASEEGGQTGFRPVVLSLYEGLQPVLNNTADYWLQRAKAYFKLVDKPELLLDGIGYAIKAYHEAERGRTIDNAEFMIALLYGKLCSVTNYNDVGYVTEAIRWYSQAISHYSRNSRYVQSMLEDRRNYLYPLCDYLYDHHEPELLPYRDDIRFLWNVAEARW